MRSSGRRIGAVALMVPDHDAGLDFYVGVMGFDLVADVPQGPKRWVTVRPPGAQTALVLAVGEDAPPRRVAYILETDDIDGDRAAMEAAGAAFEEATRDEPYGRVAVWRDPFGNRWDLLQPAS